MNYNIVAAGLRRNDAFVSQHVWWKRLTFTMVAIVSIHMGDTIGWFMFMVHGRDISTIPN